jgi:NAD+ synthase (glutamine-hydrolysing)
MPKKLRIIMAQLNFHVGDIQGNLARHIEAANRARTEFKADVIVFPELSLTGYPPEDLLFRAAFIEEAITALHTLQHSVNDIYCVVGHPQPSSKGLYNSVSLLYNGTVQARYNKEHLPNYGVFDEKRYFISGASPGIVMIHDIPVSIIICEDIWFASPMQKAASQGARLIISPNASPFEIGKEQERQRILVKRSKAAGIPIVYVNQVGGQDDLLFDGGSMVLDAAGVVVQHADYFKEQLVPVDLAITAADTRVTEVPFTYPSQEEKVYQGLVMAVRDYIQKNRFPGVLIGVSGGIDSALVLAIAVDALGKDKVSAIVLPSRYTVEDSFKDADELIKNLGVQHETISIEPAFNSFLTTLQPLFEANKPNIVEENIQARVRAIILMALSNQSGRLVLTTGNRSELAVGYCTLYGDMAGGFDVLKDIPKTDVYRLATYRNSLSTVIPEHIITRPPTAELAPNQKDQDSLPPYDVLDQILFLYLNKEKSSAAIIAEGFEASIVNKVIDLVHRSEHKRRQAPLGPRINHTAFGRDRRYPVTSGFKK